MWIGHGSSSLNGGSLEITDPSHHPQTKLIPTILLDYLLNPRLLTNDFRMNFFRI